MKTPKLKTLLPILAVAITIHIAYFLPISENNVVYIPPETSTEEPTRGLTTKEDIIYRIEEMSVERGLDPELVKKIIYCESRFNPDARNTKAVVGEDVGLFQINTYYHLESAKAMALDIYNTQDNLTFGFYLMELQGTTPWNCSKHCWNK